MTPPTIPCYVVNLAKRQDRRRSIESEFASRSEFDVHIVLPVEDPIPAVSLYRTLVSIIKEAKEKNYPYVLLCEDDHVFTNAYDAAVLTRHIHDLRDRGAHVLLGGVSWFSHAIPCIERAYWVERFTGAQFTIIYASFYDAILESPFGKEDIIDHWISKLSENLFVMVPMISVQREFGYSDVTARNSVEGRVNELFESTLRRWEAIHQIEQHIARYAVDDVEILNTQDPNTSIFTCILQEKDTRTALCDREEFRTHIVLPAIPRADQEGMWRTIRTCVETAIKRDEDVVLICQEGHAFNKAYDRENFIAAVYQGAYLGADLVLGSAMSYHQAIVVDQNLCWIDTFRCDTYFFLLYQSFYQRILEEVFTAEDRVDAKLSALTANKYVIHPYIIQSEEDHDAKQPRKKQEGIPSIYMIYNEKLDGIRIKRLELLTPSSGKIVERQTKSMTLTNK